MTLTALLLVLVQCALWRAHRLAQFWVSVDQVLNVLIGSGYADETLSAYAHRRGGWRRTVINALFFWQADHCYQAWLSEIERRQLPACYRRTPQEMRHG